jgi:hypothetical protein
MSNLEFTSKFSQRVSMLFDSEKAAAVSEEFESLDPREANIFYRAFVTAPGTEEHLHAVTRVKALVAAGAVSPDLASMTDEKSLEVASNAADMDYILSRDALLDAIKDQQVSLDVLMNPYDKDGVLSRMVIRGKSKKEIFDYLNGKIFFQANKELADAGIDENTSLADQQTIMKFNELMDALTNLEDPTEPVDEKAFAKELVQPYDENGSLAEMIDSGSSSDEILDALSSNQKWSDDLYSYVTRYEVDIRPSDQISKWSDTERVLYALKDLDSL